MARKTIEKNIYYDDVKKLYYVNMDYGKDKTGKRIKSMVSFKTKKEAQKALKLFESEKANNTLIMPESLSLAKWLDYWVNDIKALNCEETTLYGYNNIINKHIVPAIGHIEIQKLSPQDINKYFIMLGKKKNLSTNTIRKHYDLLKDALLKAEGEDKILKSPIKKVDAPKTVITEKNYYSPTQLKELFSIVQDDRIEVVVKLAGYLGLRREEIAALKWRNIDFERKKIFIVEARTQAGGKIVKKGTKNFTSYRALSVPDDLIEVLKTVREKQKEHINFLKDKYIDNDFVFAWPDGRPYRPNYISALFSKVIKNNNLKYIRLHDLRHPYVKL